jgi:hypothetical protein
MSMYECANFLFLTNFGMNCYHLISLVDHLDPTCESPVFREKLLWKTLHSTKAK